jgi:predicted metal-dependent RNase
MRYQALDNKIKHLNQQQTHTQPPKQKFYPRVVNMTDISFSEPEMALLQKGPKYNLHDKPKDWIQNLALEAKTAISHLPSSER